MEYLKKFRADKSVNEQTQGGIWEDPITALVALKEICPDATLDDALVSSK